MRGAPKTREANSNLRFAAAAADGGSLVNVPMMNVALIPEIAVFELNAYFSFFFFSLLVV
jgi:hypothetical protein